MRSGVINEESSSDINGFGFRRKGANQTKTNAREVQQKMKPTKVLSRLRRGD